MQETLLTAVARGSHLTEGIVLILVADKVGLQVDFHLC